MSGSAAEHENANKNQENEKNESEATKRSDMGAKLVKEFFKPLQIFTCSQSLEGWASKLLREFKIYANSRKII